MNNDLSAVAQDFIKNLTGANSMEIQKYAVEITSNKEPLKRFEEDKNSIYGRRFRSRGMGIGTRLGTVLYILCRKLKPAAVVETGVASGVSSAYILSALEENNHGELHSIDLPSRGGESGWLVPDYLRYRWQLIVGRSSDKLPTLLEKLGTIDIFLHDSDHSYQNMFWEYETAWDHLKTGGILLSHNIDVNNAFSNFCRKTGGQGFLLANMGGIVK